jgi:hypothetical protein
MARILDILTFVGGKIIALDSTDRLQWSHATNTSDPFDSLKRATLDPLSNHRWRPFEVGDADIDELCQQYRRDAQERFGFPYRPKNPLPA